MEILPNEFESYVILYGTKTCNTNNGIRWKFESYVILYGTKTCFRPTGANWAV